VERACLSRLSGKGSENPSPDLVVRVSCARDRPPRRDDLARAYNRDMKPRKTKPSAQDVANIAGVSLTLVNRKLSQGKSARTIIYEAEQQAQQAAQKHPTVLVTDIVNGHANGHAANGALSFSGAQTAKENALASLRQLELAEKRRELIPVSYVRVWASRFLTEGRDILLNGLGELTDKVASETDAAKVAEILRFWLERAMLRFLETETLWGHGERLDEAVLRERFNTARLSLVKEPRR
jgi:hypothetical protein